MNIKSKILLAVLIYGLISVTIVLASDYVPRPPDIATCSTCQNPENALGDPDGLTVSLTATDCLTLTFNNPITLTALAVIQVNPPSQPVWSQFFYNGTWHNNLNNNEIVSHIKICANNNAIIDSVLITELGGPTATPIPGGDTATPIPGGDTATPIPGGDTATPIPGGDTATPIPGGDTATPIPGGDTATPIPGGDTATPIPGATIIPIYDLTDGLKVSSWLFDITGFKSLIMFIVAIIFLALVCIVVFFSLAIFMNFATSVLGITPAGRGRVAQAQALGVPTVPQGWQKLPLNKAQRAQAVAYRKALISNAQQQTGGKLSKATLNAINRAAVYHAATNQTPPGINPNQPVSMGTFLTGLRNQAATGNIGRRVKGVVGTLVTAIPLNIPGRGLAVGMVNLIPTSMPNGGRMVGNLINKLPGGRQIKGGVLNLIHKIPSKQVSFTALGHQVTLGVNPANVGQGQLFAPQYVGNNPPPLPATPLTPGQEKAIDDAIDMGEQIPLYAPDGSINRLPVSYKQP